MAGTNYIYQFAADPSALVLTDGQYQSDGQRAVGNQPGVAREDFVNKVLRQTSYMASVFAQFIVDRANVDVKDSDSVATAVANFITALQLTTGFPSGTKSVFFQAAAPTYWTKDTTHNNKALRVVSGSGGGSGGTHDLDSPPSLSHSHTGPSHTHTGPSHSHTTPGHQLSIAEMPSHCHYSQAGSNRGGSGGGNDNFGVGNAPGSYITTYVGGDAVHYHGDTGVSGTGATGYAGDAATTTVAPTAFAPKYIDVIVCTKN